ncbi:hypothetical protein EX30DRAFT_386179 [Ascodesmis nigricans]|uniref:DUF8004 domain-containing protein n=1 Tax=Ascodesmis nigricans TaxID=341454 RepID=A0A4S2MLJ1_9PEZI|nr:hypothetical protein EX30DRAFT_386179 [Ascodesmis nigricans]
MSHPQDRTLHRRSSVTQTFRRLARRLSITSLTQSRSPRSPQLKPVFSPPSSRPPSRLGLSLLRRPSMIFSSSSYSSTNASIVAGSTVSASTVTQKRFQTIPERDVAGSGSWPPPATLVKKGGKPAPYDLTPLLACGRVPELWEEGEEADTLVYLCAKEEAGKDGRGPSFKVSGEVLKQRSGFFEAALAERWQDDGDDSGRTQSGEKLKELFFPPWVPDAGSVDILHDRIALRNFFSFILSNGPRESKSSSSTSTYGFLLLPPTHDHLLLYHLTLRISMYSLPAPSASTITNFLLFHGLDDPRSSPLRTLDVLLASHLSTPPLLPSIRRESFLHAAGQYLPLLSLPEYHQLVPEDLKLRLQRNHHAIQVRVQRSQAMLKSLAFPSLSDNGTTLSSTSGGVGAAGRTPIPPTGWLPAFKSLRALIITHYSKLFRTRHWPPRNFSRGMALMVIRDIQLLQSLLYDPNSSSFSSSSSSSASSSSSSNTTGDQIDPYRALLTALTSSSKYPRLPSPSSSTPHSQHNRLSPDEAAVMVLDCWSASPSSPTTSSSSQLLDKVRILEIREATGKTRGEFVEQREGRWVLLAVVRRAVESVVGRGEWDGVRWGWGVEWWLCADWEGGREGKEREEEIRVGRGRRGSKEKEVGGVKGVEGRSGERRSESRSRGRSHSQSDQRPPQTQMQVQAVRPSVFGG